MPTSRFGLWWGQATIGVNMAIASIAPCAVPGYTVYAINDHEPQVEGDTAYARLADLPQVPTVVDMVIPPWNALPVVEEAASLGVKALWFQPGAENPAAIRWAREQGLDVIEDCILVHHIQQSTI